jgi:MOSC domain-containing protein YiiM
MGNGEVISIHIASSNGGPMQSVEQAQAVPGRGLDGDRYFLGAGTFSKKQKPARQVTLIEVEAIDALIRDHGVELDPGDARRNIITRGVALNHLIGKDFVVGEVRLRGLELCEPCGYLEGLTRRGVKRGLIHRGGLRAEILAGGTIRVGDPIRVGAPL